MKRKLLILLPLIVLFCSGAAFACPACKDANVKVTSDEGQGWAQGFSVGMTFMIALPILAIAGIGIPVVRAYRSGRLG